jgi:hypothetical protein
MGDGKYTWSRVDDKTYLVGKHVISVQNIEITAGQCWGIIPNSRDVTEEVFDDLLAIIARGDTSAHNSF